MIPAILFGIDGVSSKAAMRAGLSWAPFIVITGVVISLVGLVGLAIDVERRVSWAGAGFAALKGVVWAIGCSLVAIALDRYKAPLAQLAPLYNTNALIAVALALVIFREHAALDVPRLMVGAVMIVVGATVVASAG